MKTILGLRLPHLLLLTFATLVLWSCDENPVDGDDDKDEGRVAFWTDVANEGAITISVEGEPAGTLTTYFTGRVPTCGESGTLTLRRPGGAYTFTAKSAAGSEWSGTVYVADDDCTTMRLYKEGGGGGGGQTGTGTVAFWTDIGDEGTISIWVDGRYAGGLTHHFQTRPQCGQSGTLPVSLAAGSHSYSATSESGSTWSGTIEITADRCVTMRLYR